MSDLIPFIVLSMVAVAFLLLLCGCKRQGNYKQVYGTDTLREVNRILRMDPTLTGVIVFHGMDLPDTYVSRKTICELSRLISNDQKLDLISFTHE
jgi:hypothetical protein